MPSLACLSGLTLPAPLLSCGPWRLLRFRRDQPLAWPSLLSADEIAARLEDTAPGVADRTLIVPADRPLGADFGPDARQRILRFGERLSCATLVQRWLEPVTERQRHVLLLRICMRDWLAAPALVPAPARPDAWSLPPAVVDDAPDTALQTVFDAALLQALVGLDRLPQDLSEPIDKALRAYGLALAQAEHLVPATALLLLGTALCCLMASQSYDEALRRRILREIALLSGPDAEDPDDVAIDTGTGLPGGLLLGRWLEDLFACLSGIGRGEPLRGGAWIPRSHMRLLGLLFPLLLKASLARLGLYRLDGADIGLIGCFETLTAAEPRMVGSRRPGIPAPPATMASIVHRALEPEPQTAPFEDALAWFVNHNLLGPSS